MADWTKLVPNRVGSASLNMSSFSTNGRNFLLRQLATQHRLSVLIAPLALPRKRKA